MGGREAVLYNSTMPFLQNNRQPEAMDWFAGAPAQTLLLAEQALISGALVTRPALSPWLWLAPCAAAADEVQLPPGSLRLHRDGTGLAGSARCALPLPLPNESIGNLILQHVLDEPGDQLLEECVRTLEPGGRVWLFTLNPWSPYRARWTGSGLSPHGPQDWRQRLRGLGLQPCAAEISYIGPVWQPEAGAEPTSVDRLRAACLLQVEKRTAAPIPPAPVKAEWQPGAAPA